MSHTPTIAELLARAGAAGVRSNDLPSPRVSDRRVAGVTGAHNLRDVGGYVTADGRVVRTGLVFRSDHLNALTDDDVAALTAIGIRRIHDLRTDLEVERQPSRPVPGAEVVRLATGDFASASAATMIEAIGDILAGRAPLPPPTFWADNYRHMLAESQRVFAALFTSMVEALPALYHCTGGKDRTGTATVLLHRVLGVADDDLLDDFLATNLFRTPVRLAALSPQFAAAGVHGPDMVPILGVERSAMEAMLAVLDGEHGGAEAYLVGGGFDPAGFDVLRSALLA